MRQRESLDSRSWNWAEPRMRSRRGTRNYARRAARPGRVVSGEEGGCDIALSFSFSFSHLSPKLVSSIRIDSELILLDSLSLPLSLFSPLVGVILSVQGKLLLLRQWKSSCKHATLPRMAQKSNFCARRKVINFWLEHVR